MNTGTPIAREALGQHLQRDRLAGAGGAGDQPWRLASAGSSARSVVAVLGNDKWVHGAGSR
jgi:hypothetical protein